MHRRQRFLILRQLDRQRGGFLVEVIVEEGALADPGLGRDHLGRYGVKSMPVDQLQRDRLNLAQGLLAAAVAQGLRKRI